MTIFSTRLMTAACAALLATPCLLRAQDQEWEQSSPYYEDDAWYDITEWFDGNDYNPVGEFAGDVDSDVDHDYGGGYDAYWGYDDAYDGDDWFYDYYDDGYVDYYGHGDYYPNAWSYYDYDGDGFYDGYWYYQDSDRDGIYDEYDQHPFGSTSGNQSGTQQDTGNNRSTGNNRNQRDSGTRASGQRTQGQQPRWSGRREVSGTITNSKTVKVRDQQRRIVKVEQSGGGFVLVDLGPKNALGNLQFDKGSRITVHGPMTKVGDRRILLAQDLQTGDRTRQIHRQGAKLQGTVTGMRSFQVNGAERQLAILDTGDQKWLLDLGQKQAMPTSLSRGQQVTVHGVPCKKDDQKLLLVRSLQRGDQQFQIDRQAMAMGQRSGQARSSSGSSGGQQADGQQAGRQGNRSGDRDQSRTSQGRAAQGRSSQGRTGQSSASLGSSSQGDTSQRSSSQGRTAQGSNPQGNRTNRGQGHGQRTGSSGDAWSDVTQWFEGNEYDPGQEGMNQDEEWNSDYGYDTWWGYDDVYDDDDWFYDYYDDSYLDYYGDGNFYPHAWSYYDYDHDGFYDAYEYYRDTDRDGIYDVYDYHPFGGTAATTGNQRRTNNQGTGNQSNQGHSDDQQQGNRQQQGDMGNPQHQRSSSQRQRSSQRREVTGTIANTKNVDVRNRQRCVVKIELDDGGYVVADLGPKTDVDNLKLDQGARITVRGPMTRLGERQLLLAQSVDVGRTSQRIQRHGMQLQGTLAGMRSFQLHGAEEQLGILDTAEDKWLLDFGRKQAMPTTLTRGKQVTVHGIPCKRGDKKVLLVQSFESGGEQFQVDRTQDLPETGSGNRTGSQQQGSRSGQGSQPSSGHNPSGDGDSGSGSSGDGTSGTGSSGSRRLTVV